MSDNYKPETVPAAFRDRKSRLDAAIDGDDAPKKRALPNPKETEAAATGLPNPGLFKKIKSFITGK